MWSPPVLVDSATAGRHQWRITLRDSDRVFLERADRAALPTRSHAACSTSPPARSLVRPTPAQDAPLRAVPGFAPHHRWLTELDCSVRMHPAESPGASC